MPTPILATKLYVPPFRADVVSRSRLTDRLNDDLCRSDEFARKLTLISAPAGFGKTTLVSEWVAGCERPAAWLSLDDGDSDPARFLALFDRGVADDCAAGGRRSHGHAAIATAAPVEAIVTALLNELAALPDRFRAGPGRLPRRSHPGPVDACARISARAFAAANAPGHHHARRPAASAGPAARPRPNDRTARLQTCALLQPKRRIFSTR